MISLSAFTKLRVLIVVAHVLGVWGMIEFWDPSWLALTVVSNVLFLWVGHELYLHRFLAHKSFEMSVAWQRVFALLSVFNLFGTPVGIVSTHIQHHKHTDAKGDPHPASSPIQTWLWIYPLMGKASNSAAVKRLMRDRWIAAITKHYFSIYIATVLIAAMIDVRIAIYGFLLHVVYAFFANSMINVICHKYGYTVERSKDNSKNNLYVNTILLCSGAALHNAHHSNPSAYKLSRAWYEIDLVGWMIEFIKTRKRAV